MSFESPPADVGVVIPSRGRPDLLRRALASVTAQTVRPREVVVVLDGADPDVERELGARDDLPLRVAVVDPPRGPAHARNLGASMLETALVAFLDDDDEWLPQKLERQLPLLEEADVSYTRVVIETPRGTAVWPRRSPAGESASDYLFDRRRPWSGAGLLNGSTITVRRDLINEVKFDESLGQHEDWDWSLRVTAAGRLAFCNDVLAIWHVDPARRTRSSVHDWRVSLEWARLRRDLFTPRAYSAFLLVNVYAIALRSHDRRAAATLAREAVRSGAPSLSQWAIFATLTVVPPDSVNRLRFAARRRAGRSSLAGPPASPPRA